MFDMGGRKVICIWCQSSLGNVKTTFDGGIFTADAFRNGHMWTDQASISLAIDHWNRGNVFIKRLLKSFECNEIKKERGTYYEEN